MPESRETRRVTLNVQQWPELPYEDWLATCDTLHAHTQVLGKLCVELAPPEPQLLHAALRLTARGFETRPLPVPDGSGAMVVCLDLRAHEALVEHNDGRTRRILLTPNVPVAEVTRGVLAAVAEVGGRVDINTRPQEVPWDVPLDEDYEHHTYDPEQVTTYFAAATRAALVLAELRAPYRRRSTAVNAWWGSFDLAVSLFSGRPADPPSDDFIVRDAANAEQIEVGWWPGDGRYPKAAFFGFAAPASDSFAQSRLTPLARWDANLGEFIVDWQDVVPAPDPHRAAVEFGRAVFRQGCISCNWDPVLGNSAMGVPPPVI